VSAGMSPRVRRWVIPGALALLVLVVVIGALVR
jgi:hypothetical protein